MSYIMDSVAANESKDFYYKTAGCVQRGFTLYRQMLPHHVGIQLRALTLCHHCSLGHHDVLLGKAGGKVKPLFHQQNREAARFFESDDDILDLIDN